MTGSIGYKQFNKPPEDKDNNTSIFNWMAGIGIALLIPFNTKMMIDNSNYDVKFQADVEARSAVSRITSDVVNKDAVKAVTRKIYLGESSILGAYNKSNQHLFDKIINPFNVRIKFAEAAKPASLTLSENGPSVLTLDSGKTPGSSAMDAVKLLKAAFATGQTGKYTLSGSKDVSHIPEKSGYAAQPAELKL